MPKIKVSALLTGIKGKSEGSVFSNNRGGAYYRSNRNFGAKSSIRWNTQRASFGELSQQWRKLTANQQTQWNNAAANFPAIDAWGNPRTRSGYETYMYLNATLKKLGIAANNTPPSPLGTIDHGLPQVVITAGPIINVTWPIAIQANDVLNVYAGAVVSTGRGFVPGKMKYMGSQSAVAATTLDITVPYRSEEHTSELQSH